MTYDWYKIVNRNEFLATGLTSRELTLDLEGLGQKTVMVFSGIMVSLLYDDVFLSAELNDENPFAFDSHAVYVDANDDLWLGILNAS